MRFRLTDHQQAWQREVARFLDEHLPPEYEFPTDFDEREDRWAFALDFTRRVGEKRWLTLGWPVEWGGLDRNRIDQAILREEFEYRAAPVVNAVAHGLVGNSILRFGTEAQKDRFLPDIVHTRKIWVEGLTEPDAGSDLASLRTSAVRADDGWIVTGQKTYVTWGHRGDWIYLAARTDPARSDHRGISIFAVELHQPGIQIAPLHNMAGGRQNHIFFDHVQVPAENLIGVENRGWDCIMHALYSGAVDPMVTIGRLRRIFDRVLRFSGETQRNGVPLLRDALLRRKLAEAAVEIEGLRLLRWDDLCRAERGQSIAFGGALAGMLFREFNPKFAQMCMEILGPLGQLSDPDTAPLRGEIEHYFRQSFGNHGGGTPQLKRVQVATRGLGLPR